MSNFLPSRPIWRPFLATLLTALCLAACGGGGGGTVPPVATTRLVGEVLATPAQLHTGELQANAGYTGALATSLALQQAGRVNLLDMLFMMPPSSTQAPGAYQLAADTEAQLLRYIQHNAGLLQPGVRALIHDEMFWNPQNPSDSMAVLQPQIDALKAAVALMRKHAPQVRVGITITPWGSMGQPNTLAAIRQAIALVDWVGTDPYWYGDVDSVNDLNRWTRDFPGMARQAHPLVETWLIAQAFKDPGWDTTTFNTLMTEQLTQAAQYDHIIFFGWQFVSELPMAFAGQHFSKETKQVYARYLKPGVL